MNKTAASHFRRFRSPNRPTTAKPNMASCELWGASAAAAPQALPALIDSCAVAGPVTVAAGMEKQLCESAGELEMVQSTVPVYPFTGVMVMADCPVPPAATAASAAANPKVLPAGTLIEMVALELA